MLAACHATAPEPVGTLAPGEAQASYEPRSEPGTGQDFLARMAGDWTVQKTFHRRGGGEPSVTRGTCHQRMIHGNRFLQCDFAFDGGSTGTGVIGFDAATGRFTSFWIDSRSTRVSVRQSEAAFDGQQIELVSRSIGEDEGARVSRTVTRFEGDDRIVHRQSGRASDGSERLVMELLMTRQR